MGRKATRHPRIWDGKLRSRRESVRSRGMRERKHEVSSRDEDEGELNVRLSGTRTQEPTEKQHERRAGAILPANDREKHQQQPSPLPRSSSHHLPHMMLRCGARGSGVWPPGERSSSCSPPRFLPWWRTLFCYRSREELSRERVSLTKQPGGY